MPARLILNADDFGLTRGINRAVAELHDAGALTSATLMAGGSAFDDAVSVAQSRPALGVGCHVVLTDGTPLSPPSSIPSLLGPDGRTFRPSLVSFLLAALLGRVRGEEIELEALAQIAHLQRAGIHVTHLDTHKHTHILPAVARPLLRAAERSGVRAVRNPFEQPWSLALSHGSPMRLLQVHLMRRLRPRFAALPAIAAGNVLTTDGTVGISATGRLDAPMLRKLLHAMPDGVWEIVCHPGYNDRDLDAVTTRLRTERDIERLALLSEFARPGSSQRQTSQPNEAELIHYGDLRTAREQSTPVRSMSTAQLHRP